MGRPRKKIYKQTVIGRNLARLIVERGFGNETALSRVSGIQQQTINKIISGETPNPRINTLQPLADALQCTVDEIKGLSETMTAKRKTIGDRKIPLRRLGKPMNQASIGQILVDDVLAEQLSSEAFSVVLEDSSMDAGPRPIRSGDRVVVEPTLAPGPGDLVVAALPDGREVLRRYRPAEGGGFELVPASDDWPVISSADGATIIAVAVEIRYTLRRKQS